MEVSLVTVVTIVTEMTVVTVITEVTEVTIVTKKTFFFPKKNFSSQKKLFFKNCLLSKPIFSQTFLFTKKLLGLLKSDLLSIKWLLKPTYLPIYVILVTVVTLVTLVTVVTLVTLVIVVTRRNIFHQKYFFR